MSTPITRRSLVRIGLGALACASVPGSSWAAPARAKARARACILLYMNGGPSQIDTLDPKPGRPTGGEFRSIPTRVPGVHVCEHLPGLAVRLDRLALVRSLVAREGNHDRARVLMHTGAPPQGGVVRPGLGALVSEASEPGALPRSIAIGGPGGGAGFVGARHAPMVVLDPTKPVRNLAPTTALPPGRSAARLDRFRALQDRFARGRVGEMVDGHRDVVEQAAAMATAPQLAAFDLGRESAAMRRRYGESRFGLGCLMARRLVEAGVPFVEVAMGGWDTHEDGFAQTRSLCGELDPAMSALLDDLSSSGLLDETLVLWWGDFGRTPRINARGGRDHFPDVCGAMLAGAGTPGGVVVGATDRDGEEIVERPLGVADLFRTVALRLGLDPDDTRVSPSGRPITLVDGGTEIPELG